VARLRISHPAEADLENIFALSFERWGADGLARYSALIEAAFRAVAANPTGPTTRDRSSLVPGLRSLHLRNARTARAVHQPAHLIYYRAVDDGSIEIVRVLHERVDPSLHLEPPMRRGPKRRSH
jgi:toxin ParE1/3/4